MQKEFLPTMKKLALGIILLVFVSVFFTDAFFLPSENTAQTRTKECFANQDLKSSEKVLKLSEISGPMIDEQAASISCREIENEITSQGLPERVWVLLLFAYAALLVFNLAYEFKKTIQVRWAWESILTGIFLFGWVYLDREALNIWFPLYMLKIAIVAYVAYLYFFARLKKNQ